MLENNNLIGYPIYIYTIPKAGTYLLGNLLEELGYLNTGWHISANSYLDTHRFDDVINKEYPSKTEVKKPYMSRFKKVKPNHFAFGHFTPLRLPNKLNSSFLILSSYRNPREVLKSSFIYSQYLRKDTKFNEHKIVDFESALEIYLEKKAITIRNIFIDFLQFQDRYNHPIYSKFVIKNNFCFDFKDLISPNPDQCVIDHFSLCFNRLCLDIKLSKNLFQSV
jgi:hypothetical protein